MSKSCCWCITELRHDCVTCLGAPPTTDEHGIMLVLGNGKRTKPRRKREKSVHYSHEPTDVHLITPLVRGPDKMIPGQCSSLITHCRVAPVFFCIQPALLYLTSELTSQPPYWLKLKLRSQYTFAANQCQIVFNQSLTSVITAQQHCQGWFLVWFLVWFWFSV